jgi:hypothetical protein
LAGDTVVITSGPFKSTTRTDDNGAFGVAGVPVPYDVLVFAPVGPSVRFLGLTRPDLTLTDLFSSTAQMRAANISGQLMGGTYPEPAGVTTRFAFTSPQTLSSVNYSSDGSFASTVQWQGPATTTGTLYALQIQFSPPMNYGSYGSLSGIPLEDLGSLTGQNVSLVQIPSATMSVTLAPTSGYTFSEATVQFLLAPDATLDLLFLNALPNTTNTFPTPLIANTSLAVSANATSDAGAFIEASQNGACGRCLRCLDHPRRARSKPTS